MIFIFRSFESLVSMLANNYYESVIYALVITTLTLLSGEASATACLDVQDVMHGLMDFCQQCILFEDFSVSHKFLAFMEMGNSNHW